MNLEYTDTITPRVSDINYGGHLGHVELINLLHEIRVRFLNMYSLKEIDINGHILIIRHLNVTYKNQVFWNNVLAVNMKIAVDGAQIVFNYRIFNTTLNNEAAIAETKMILLNKEKQKPVKLDFFIRMLDNENNEQ